MLKSFYTLMCSLLSFLFCFLHYARYHNKTNTVFHFNSLLLFFVEKSKFFSSIRRRTSNWVCYHRYVNLALVDFCWSSKLSKNRMYFQQEKIVFVLATRKIPFFCQLYYIAIVFFLFSNSFEVKLNYSQVKIISRRQTRNHNTKIDLPRRTLTKETKTRKPVHTSFVVRIENVMACDENCICQHYKE